jgi:hypothetical protein
MIHGHTKRAILRRWNAGLKLAAIAKEFCIGPTEAAQIIVSFGVCWSAIATRERNER